MLARQGSEMQQPVLLHDRRTGNAAGHIDILIAGDGGAARFDEQPGRNGNSCGRRAPSPRPCLRRSRTAHGQSRDQRALAVACTGILSHTGALRGAQRDRSPPGCNCGRSWNVRVRNPLRRRARWSRKGVKLRERGGGAPPIVRGKLFR